MRRTHLRGHANILKRLLIHVGEFNLGLLLRTVLGVGTPRSLQGHLAAPTAVVVALWGPRDARTADQTTTFTPHRHLELLPSSQVKDAFNHGLLRPLRPVRAAVPTSRPSPSQTV